MRETSQRTTAGVREEIRKMTRPRKTEIYSMWFSKMMIYIEILCRTNLQNDRGVNNTHRVMAKVKENR